MKLKKLAVLGTILAFLLSFPLHFLYSKFPYFITSIIAPVNESIWEHMKILFGGIIIAGIIQKLIVYYKKLDANNVIFANLSAAVLSIPLFLMIYLPVYYSIGEHLTLTIILMLIAIAVSEVIAFLIMKQRNLKLETVSAFLIMAAYALFTLLAYYPPQQSLFLDPIKLSYGI